MFRNGVARSRESVLSCGACQAQACYSTKAHPLHKTLTGRQQLPVLLQWGPADWQSHTSSISRTLHCSLTEKSHSLFASQMNDGDPHRFGSLRFGALNLCPGNFVLIMLLSILICGFGIILVCYISKWNIYPIWKLTKSSYCVFLHNRQLLESFWTKLISGYIH